MDQQVLNTFPRTQTTKGELNKHRAQGRIPAVIYGGGTAATQVFLDEKEFLKVTSGISESTILGIDVNGKKTRAFIKARQRNSITTKIIHIDFLEVVSGRLIRARVPIHLIGQIPIPLTSFFLSLKPLKSLFIFRLFPIEEKQFRLYSTIECRE